MSDEKKGPESAGWDEIVEKDIPQTETKTTGAARERTSGGGTASSAIAKRAGEKSNKKVDYTRPPQESYPSGVTKREREREKRR